MGCARNLKLGGERGARARAQRDTIFFGVWFQCGALFSCCVHGKDAAEIVISRMTYSWKFSEWCATQKGRLSDSKRVLHTPRVRWANSRATCILMLKEINLPLKYTQ